MFTSTESLNYENKLMMFMKIFMKIGFCLILVIIHEIQIFHLLNKRGIGKTKDEFKGKIISEFGGLKSKMYSLVNVDGEEKNGKRRK